MQRTLPQISFLRRALFGAALAAVAAVPAQAGVLSASASISNTQVMTGEAFQLNVQVSSDKKENLPWPQVQGLEPFQVSKNTSTTSGSQTTIVNGHVSQNNYYVTTFVYSLTADKSGTFNIGPIRYVDKDFSQDLGSANITVEKSVAGLTTQATLSKSRAYVGEQVLYTLRIIPKAGVQSINLPEDMQKLIGEKFYFERLEKNITPKSVTIGGQEEKVFDIHIALFPLLSGTASLEGIPIDYQQVRRTPRRQTGSVFDMFDDDFFNGGASVVNQKAMAEPLKMEVVPLPAGAPAGFTGSVGQYSLAAAVDKASAAAGDAITLTVSIRGNGQPKSITKPVLPDLSAFEVYDPEETVATNMDGNTLWTVKTFKYVIIPQRQGTYNLQDIRFPYFDPRRGEYARAAGEPITLQIGPGKENQMPLASAMPQHEITELGTDIRHIKTDDGLLENESDLPYHHLWFPGLFVLSPLAFAGSLVLRRRSERLRTDAALQRRARADSHLRRRLKNAQQNLTSGPREFYHALSEAVMEFASDRLNLEFRGMTLEEAKTALLQHGGKPETVQEYEALLQRCDFGRFGGLSGSEPDRKQELSRSEALLEKLEKELA